MYIHLTVCKQTNDINCYCYIGILETIQPCAKKDSGSFKYVFTNHKI